ncbi:hypothetical protein LUZ63_011180 [Rhynchospora breviuscula]|uniref:Dof zinc finger protein n=1 Tax=Rhynchospora breviuscula TaxID=2022672 RepID=A0A9Q0HQA7_9POAL|nr:hypothetical protein LUZ63_011180 [Rhynchospora breviuscula]
MGPVSEPVYNNSSDLSQNGEHEADLQQPDKKSPLKCPRCESTNTKFCYYNNYSRLQPRHFCRACRRHWTAGGTLRDVPFGGGRKYTKRRKISQNFCNASGSATSTTTSESFTDTNATFPYGEPRYLPAQLPPLEYGIGPLYNDIGTNTEFAFIGSSYDIMNVFYNEGMGPAWQMPDISPAGYWDEINDLV